MVCMEKQIKRAANLLAKVLEWVINSIVLIAIAVAIVSLWDPFMDFLSDRTAKGAFLEFLGYAFNVVIGIEFFKMLCKPDTDTILEVLMFVIARHMIITETSSLENLLTIVGVGCIFVIKKYLQIPRRSRDCDEEESGFLCETDEQI